MRPDARWRPGQNTVRCAVCADAGWVKPGHPRPWELRPRDTLVPCPACRGQKQ